VSGRLEAAVREVEQVFPTLQEILRVDVNDEGGLVLTAVGREATRWFTHDDRGLIECYPERDKKLPLSAHLAASSGWKVLSYRPARRMVARLERGEGCQVLKGHKKSRSARAAMNQGIAEGAMRRGAFRVPRMLSHDGEHEALVFEFLAGHEVELTAESVPLYARLGSRLALFQRDESAADLKVFGVRDELAVLELWQRKVLGAADELPAGWAAVHARLLEHAERLPAPVLGLAHRDLHDRQVHLVEGDVALLDFDLLCRADVALDAGNLLAHLAWRALQGLHGADTAAVQALQAAFLEGLGRTREAGFGARLSFYTASAFLRLALVYRLRPRWSSRVDSLLSRATATLDDLVSLR